MELSVTDLKDLVAALSQSDVVEFTLKGADFELILRKSGAVSGDGGATPKPLPATPVAEAVPLAAPAPTAPPGKASDLVAITSPMVGTFYRSPAPDEAPFVGVGDRITSGQPVCIIEAMKLMNELEAEVSGEIVEIVVDNGQPVEFGQTLMLVRPV